MTDTTATDLAALLARVEEAEGPDRELEAAIHMALFPDDFASKVMRGEYAVESWELGRGGISYVSLNSGGTSGGTQPVPHVSSSLDASLALCGRVLPGWIIRADIYTTHASMGVEPPWSEDGPECRPVEAEAKTPALALIAALLRALQAQSEAGEPDA